MFSDKLDKECIMSLYKFFICSCAVVIIVITVYKQSLSFLKEVLPFTFAGRAVVDTEILSKAMELCKLPGAAPRLYVSLFKLSFEPSSVPQKGSSSEGSLPDFIQNSPCDAAEPWQLGSQDAATPMMQGIIDLHHDIFFFLILILVFVSRILVRALWHFHYKKNPIPQRIVHGTTIEILRTIFPSIIPMFIAIPSFALLYSMDEVVVDPAMTIKAIGHQWYRSAPLHEGDLSATKCLKVEYGSRSIWLTGNLPFPPSRDFHNYSMPETGS